MNTDDMASALYGSEINFCVTCFWDGGFESCLGDFMNGYANNHQSDTFPEAVKAVYDEAIKRGLLSRQKCQCINRSGRRDRICKDCGGVITISTLQETPLEERRAIDKPLPWD